MVGQDSVQRLLKSHIGIHMVCHINMQAARQRRCDTAHSEFRARPASACEDQLKHNFAKAIHLKDHLRPSLQSCI